MFSRLRQQCQGKGFFVLTFGSKIAYCAAFVFIRADEYHKTLTDVLRKVSVSNVGALDLGKTEKTRTEDTWTWTCLLEGRHVRVSKTAGGATTPQPTHE